MTHEIDEEHVVRVRFNDPRDKAHGVNKNYYVRLKVSKASSKAHAESKVALHMRKSGYIITSMKTTRRKKKLKEETEVNELHKSTLRNYVGKSSGDPKREKGIRLAISKVIGGAKVPGKSFNTKSQFEETELDEVVAGMDHANKIYAGNSSGGTTIWTGADDKKHRVFTSKTGDKPANKNARIHLVRGIKMKEELEMDEPANIKAQPLNFILAKGKYKGPTDYKGNTPDERKIVAKIDASINHAPDREGNTMDVFSATGLKRSVTAVNRRAAAGEDVSDYNAANEEVIDEASGIEDLHKKTIHSALTKSGDYDSSVESVHGDHVWIRGSGHSNNPDGWAKKTSATLTKHGVHHDVVDKGLFSDKTGPVHRMKIKVK